MLIPLAVYARVKTDGELQCFTEHTSSLIRGRIVRQA